MDKGEKRFYAYDYHVRRRPLQAWLLVLVGGVTPAAFLAPLPPARISGSVGASNYSHKSLCGVISLRY